MKKFVISIAMLILVLVLTLLIVFWEKIFIKESKTTEVEKVQSDFSEDYKKVNIQSHYSNELKNIDDLAGGPLRKILKVKVLGIEDAVILPSTKYYHNPYLPCTPISVEIIESLYGEAKLRDNKIYMQNGRIKLSELEKTLDDVDKERMGINKLTQKEKEEQYREYADEYTVFPKVGKEYIVVVADLDEGYYKIISSGVGILEEVEKDGKTILWSPAAKLYVEKEALLENAEKLKTDPVERKITNEEK